MENRFFLNGLIDTEMVRNFKKFLRNIRKNSIYPDTIKIRIISEGGNSHAAHIIERFIFELKNKHKIRFIMEAEIALSGAFRIFIRGNERIITKKSQIAPHLPEAKNTKEKNPESLKERDILVITNRLPLFTREDIVNYNDVNIPWEIMLQKNIATKLVENFT